MDTERTVVSGIRTALTGACAVVREGLASDGVAGIVPAFVASPASTEEASALLRAAAAHDLAVVPRGAGTGLGWGLPGLRCDLVVDMQAMDQVLEHAAGDLVVRVQAGVTIGQLASVLARAGQQLALDVPAEATVGGMVGTGTAGPRRFRYGAPRDLLIGITAVRADGVVAHAGGKVVKNVAGYDIGKLLAGSQGTLALITEATFRLHPLPEAVAYVTAEFGPAQRGAAGVAAVAAGAASRGAARGHLARSGGTSQADVGAAGVGGRITGGRRGGGRAATVGAAALPQHRDPRDVLGRQAGRGARRDNGGRGGCRGSGGFRGSGFWGSPGFRGSDGFRGSPGFRGASGQRGRAGRSRAGDGG